MQHTPITGIHDVIRLTDAIPESDDPVIRHARSVLNKSLFGSLTMEFDARQVIVSNVRGDAAMRFHAIVSDHRDGDPSSARWADQHDPRYSTADARLVTFEVSRILSMLWEPERLVHGDGARRQLVCACIRIIQTAAKHKDPRDWDTQDLVDYGTVTIDMDSEAARRSDKDLESEPDAEDDDPDTDPDPADLDDGVPDPLDKTVEPDAPTVEGTAEGGDADD